VCWKWTGVALCPGAGHLPPPPPLTRECKKQVRDDFFYFSEKDCQTIFQDIQIKKISEKFYFGLSIQNTKRQKI
jgi:hypothetical protein